MCKLLLTRARFVFCDSQQLFSVGDCNTHELALHISHPSPQLVAPHGGPRDTHTLFHLLPFKLLVACLVVAAAPATFFLSLIIAARVGGSQTEPFALDVRHTQL